MSDIADIRMFAGLLRRQMWTILSTIACVLFLTASTLMLMTPRYTAQALILVDTSAKNLLDPAASATTGLTDNSRVEGEVRIVQSDAVLLDVVRAPATCLRIASSRHGAGLATLPQVLSARRDRWRPETRRFLRSLNRSRRQLGFAGRG